MALTRRMELLFDPDQYARLEEIARSRGESVAAVVRRAVERECLRPTLEQRRAAVERLLSMESDITWEEAKEIIETEVGRRLEAS